MNRRRYIYIILLIFFISIFSGISVANEIDTNILMQEKLLIQNDIEEGIYKIFIGEGNRKSLDIVDGSKDTGAQIQIWTYLGVEQQQFCIEKTDDGYYSIKSLMSDLYLTISDNNNITQQMWNNSSNQKWIFQKNGAVYNIISLYNNLAMEFSNANNGTKITGNIINGSTNQEFRLERYEKKQPTKSIEEGKYRILANLKLTQAFDIDCGSLEDGAKAQIWEDLFAVQQKFILQYDEDGYYKIINDHSKKVLTINGRECSGTNIVQMTDNNQDNQKWILVKQQENAYNIVSKTVDCAITINTSDNGQILTLEETTNSTNQQFSFVDENSEEKAMDDIEDGRYYIELANKKVLDIRGAGLDNYTRVQTWAKEDVPQQIFRITKVPNTKYYTIMPEHSGKMIDVSNGSLLVGAAVGQYDYNWTDSQMWYFIDAGDGYYNIVSKKNRLVMDVANGLSDQNGKDIQLYYNNGTIAQKFKLVKKEEYTEKSIDGGLYKIFLNSNRVQAFDIDCGSLEDGATAQIWEDLDAIQQKFQIKYLENGYYKIINNNSGKALTLANSASNGTQIIQSTDEDNNDFQEWIIKKKNNNIYTIMSKEGNYYLTVEYTNNGAKLKLSNYTNIPLQEFIFVNQLPEENGVIDINDGIYNISSLNGKSIEVKGGWLDNYNPIQSWEYSSLQHQKFRVKRIGNTNGYTITAVHSAMALDVPNGSKKIGVNLQQYEQNGTDSQIWYFIPTDVSGVYNIVSRKNGFNISVGNNNSDVVSLNYNDNSNNEKFRFNPVNIIEWGPFEIETRIDSNRVIDVDCGSMNNGANVQIWDPQNKNQERFYFEAISNEEVVIRNVNSGKVLTVENGRNVAQYDYWENDTQIWRVIERGNNYYSFSNKSNGELLDVQDASTANGTNIQVWPDNGNYAQQFRLVSGYRTFFEQGTYGTSGKRQSNQGGYDLTYYKIGQGSKHLFLTFSIHGFEDYYWKDGAELTYMANQLKDYLYNNMSEALVNEWTIYIFPTLNPDGQYDGWTNDGPGRTSVYSYAPNNQGIDMNRGFSVGYQRMYSTRNYNGTEPFQAPEAAQLRDFILNHQGASNVLIDVHGWLNETIGDNGIGSYYRNEFGISNHIGTYGNGYLVNWARSIPNTRSMLLELPGVSSHDQVVNWDYSGKFIRATMRLLEDF